MEKELKNALFLYESLCSFLEEKEVEFKRNDEDLSILFGSKTNDIPLNIMIQISVKKQLISLYSLLPFKVKDEKRTECALALCHVNQNLMEGSFDYTMEDGSIFFRMTTSFIGSLLSKEVFFQMIAGAMDTVDEYNDKIFSLNEGKITIDEFIKNN